MDDKLRMVKPCERECGKKSCLSRTGWVLAAGAMVVSLAIAYLVLEASQARLALEDPLPVVETLPAKSEGSPTSKVQQEKETSKVQQEKETSKVQQEKETSKVQQEKEDKAMTAPKAAMIRPPQQPQANPQASKHILSIKSTRKEQREKASAFAVDSPPPLVSPSHPAIVSRQLIVPVYGHFSTTCCMIFDQMRTWSRRPKSQHAATIVETAPGIVLAAWFGGTWEGRGNVGIYTASFKNGQWVNHRLLIKPSANKGKGGKKLPLWNPVLCHLPTSHETLLFYKLLGALGGTPQSLQGGAPDKYMVGPAKNKCLLLDGGLILAGASREVKFRDETDYNKAVNWTTHIEYSPDGGQSWKTGPSIEYEGNIIQPSLFLDSQGHVALLARERGPRIDKNMQDGHIVISRSNSKTGLSQWGPGRRTNLPCPNSGLDAVRLTDGRLLVVYNHSRKRFGARNIINLATSSNDGESWTPVMTLENYPKVRKEFSYPAIIQAADGLVHIAYTYSVSEVYPGSSGRENIRHVVIDPQKL